MMKSSLDHLPEKKWRELERVQEILHEEFEDALSEAKAAWKEVRAHHQDHPLRLLRPRQLARRRHHPAPQAGRTRL
ncbi:hypothetical protein [Pelagibius sp.]|uniref:hypothetical protein n=1 Tax=Pelagibius sp. TaxID=1931238 RepID=UPI002AC35DAB|nr:hypothetical protein [Pelagibius sp.]